MSDARRVAPPTLDKPEIRREARDTGRDFHRERPPEPHEKFELPAARREGGMDYFWASLKVPHSDRLNPRLDTFRRAGWRFARAADFPEHSGYRPEGEVNDRFVELGIERRVQPDDPVVIDNASVLMMRPKRLSAEAKAEQDDRARSQIDDYMNTLRQRSIREIGESRTRVHRRVQRNASDEAASDAETEI